MQTEAPTPAADADARLGLRLLGLGAAGLMATCLFYVLAGPVAALPGGAASPAQAIAATPVAAGWMRAAGLTGMASDILLAVAALLLAAHEFRRGQARLLAGWLALALAAALFVIVDAMVALVLPVAAVQAGGEAAYAGLRALFDVLFAIGTVAAAGGALALGWRLNGQRRPVLAWGLRLAGGLGLLASGSHLLGGPGAALIGPGIALLALSSLGLALAGPNGSARNVDLAQDGLPSPSAHPS
nr:hypothetical protein [uncultured Roseateles sp.]